MALPPMVHAEGVVRLTVKVELAFEGSLRITDMAAESTLEAAAPVIMLAKLKATELSALELVSFQEGASNIVPVTCRLRFTSVADRLVAIDDAINNRQDLHTYLYIDPPLFRLENYLMSPPKGNIFPIRFC